jgi:multidrug efflux pump subunit AcrA (membrane-fusion protein)
MAGAQEALSWPLVHQGRCLAVFVLLKGKDEGKAAPAKDAFGEAADTWLAGFGTLAAPVFRLRRRAEEGAFVRLAENCREAFALLLGRGHLTAKAVAVLLLLAAAVLALVPVQYRVSARTVVEGQVRRIVAAPFEGFVDRGYVRAGDTVRAGQLLATLDDHALRIEEARWASERDQGIDKLREAMAKHDLAAVQVADAQKRQAAAQLSLAEDKIAHARLLAPFDGLVVSGDLSQKAGAPVEAGKELFAIAPLAHYRVILQVDERDIRHVRVGQHGELAITGIAGRLLPFSVAKVTPVATAKDGANFFRVEAALAEGVPDLRPGMEGIGKIETDRHSLWWVLMHGFSDWLRLALWRWLP